jgi:hypothetical protein
MYALPRLLSASACRKNTRTALIFLIPPHLLFYIPTLEGNELPDMYKLAAATQIDTHKETRLLEEPKEKGLGI